MLCDFVKLGIVLNITIFIILVNPLPLLASKVQHNRKDRDRTKQQSHEERQSEFVRGKSKSKLLITQPSDNFYLKKIKQIK